MALQIRQLHPLFAGEVIGIDLRDLRDRTVIDEIASALDRHAVLMFRELMLDDEQQIAFGVVAVEDGLLGQLVEIAGDGPFGAAGIAADADADEARHQDLKPDIAVGDPLFGHLDGSDDGVVSSCS